MQVHTPLCVHVSLQVLRRCCLPHNTVGLPEIMQREHADIWSRQEHQLQVTKQGHAAILCRQEVIQRGQEHQLQVTSEEHADIQHGVENIQHDVEEIKAQLQGTYLT